jgi:hypothetical protein
LNHKGWNRLSSKDWLENIFPSQLAKLFSARIESLV